MNRGSIVGACMVVGLAVSAVVNLAAVGEAGVFSYAPLTGDGDSGIATSKTYTQAADIVNAWTINPAGGGQAVTINGVAFEVGGASGTNWSIITTDVYTGDSGPGNVTGQVGNLLRYFRYGPGSGNATLTLTGLVPDESYTTTWYSKGWDVAGGRIVNVSASDGGGPYTFDQDVYGQNNGNMLTYSFTAPASGSITYTFTATGASFHQYGFSNELTSTPNQWAVASGGTYSWNTGGNWTAGSPPNGVGAVAWLLKETGSAATVTLDSAVTAGSLYLDNTAGYNIAGPNSLTMQVSSGRALISGLTGNHTISAPLVLNSDTEFAAPNGRELVITGAISGSGQFFATGLGQVRVSGNSATYSQQVNVQSGALRLGSSNAVGTGNIVISNGANMLLWWNTGSATLSNNITLNGPGLVDGKDAIYADGGGGSSGGYGTFTLSGTITLNATSNIGGHNVNHVNITGQITGPGGLTKGGSRTDENNTLFLSNASNDYAGDTTVNKGTLKLGASNVIPDGPGKGNVAVNSGALFDLGGYDETINALSGTGTVTNNRATSGTNTLTVGSNNATFSLTALLQDGTNGKLALAKTGSGQLVLNTANTYSGGTTISSGTLKSVAANATGSGAVSIAPGATWDIGVGSQTVAGLSGAGNIRSGITTGADGAGLISSSKNYLHKLDFGNNTGATVNGVAFDSVGTSGAGWSLTGATTLYAESGTPTGYAQLMNDFYYGGNPGELTFTGLTVGQMYDAVLYTQVGAWGTRPQNATFTNGTDSQQLPGTEPGTVGYYSYRFLATGTTATISMLPTAGDTFHWFGASLELASTSAPTLTIGDSNTYTFSGTIGGITRLVKQGSGTQILSGSNTYTGGTTVSQGYLRVGNAGALGSGDVSIANGASLLLWWNTGSATLTNNITLNGLGPAGGKPAIYADGAGGGHATFILSGQIALNATSNIGGVGYAPNNILISGKVTGPGGLNKGSTWGDDKNAVILFNPANDYAGNTTVVSGTLRLGASEVIPHGAGKGGVTVDAGTTLDIGNYNETINSLSGGGNVTFAGKLTGPTYFTTDAGTDVSAAKSYTHVLDFDAGSTVASVNGVAFTNAGTSGANWSFSANVNAAASNSATGMTDNGGMHVLLEDFWYNGDPAVLTLTGLTAGVTYESRFYNRAWTVGGTRTQTITFDEDGAGPASTVTVFNEDASGTPNYIGYRFTAVSDGAGGTLPLTVTFDAQSASNTYHFYGMSNEVAKLPTLTVGDSSSTTFSGTISGAGKLVKQGSGMLTLSGASTYIGPTDVNVGTLRVNGSHNGGGIYTVAQGATLGGTGTITAPVLLSGTMSPGASVGTFTTGDETWLPNGSFTLEIDSAESTAQAGSSPGWDLLVTGALDLTNLVGPDDRFRVDLVSLGSGTLLGFSADAYSTYRWDFVHATSISGFDDEHFDLNLAGFTANNVIANQFGTGTFRILQDGNNLVITFTAAVPEPGTLALLAIGGLALLVRRRRRR
jgi:fibronectin-binding autotransporter adhesin